jgi:hypothetical protein
MPLGTMMEKSPFASVVACRLPTVTVTPATASVDKNDTTVPDCVTSPALPLP